MRAGRSAACVCVCANGPAQRRRWASQRALMLAAMAAGWAGAPAANFQQNQRQKQQRRRALAVRLCAQMCLQNVCTCACNRTDTHTHTHTHTHTVARRERCERAALSLTRCCCCCCLDRGHAQSIYGISSWKTCPRTHTQSAPPSFAGHGQRQIAARRRGAAAKWREGGGGEASVLGKEHLRARSAAIKLAKEEAALASNFGCVRVSARP